MIFPFVYISEFVTKLTVRVAPVAPTTGLLELIVILDIEPAVRSVREAEVY